MRFGYDDPAIKKLPGTSLAAARPAKNTTLAANYRGSAGMTAGLELASLGFEVSDLPGWEALLTNVIGLTGNGDNADGSSR